MHANQALHSAGLREGGGIPTPLENSARLPLPAGLVNVVLAAPGTLPANVILVANQLYTFPFWIEEDMWVQGIRVGTGNTGTTGTPVRLGMYATQPDGRPGPLVVDGGAVTLAAIATLYSVLFSPVFVGRGWINMALASNSVMSVSGSAANNSALPHPSFMLHDGVTAIRSAGYTTGTYDAFTYGALPSVVPNGGTLVNGANIGPIIFVLYGMAAK